MAPQNTPPNPPDPNLTDPPAPPAPPENGGVLDAPADGDCEGVTKGLRKLVTEQYGKDYVILSVGRGKAFIQNARHAFKIETTTGNKLSA